MANRLAFGISGRGVARKLMASRLLACRLMASRLLACRLLAATLLAALMAAALAFSLSGVSAFAEAAGADAAAAGAGAADTGGQASPRVVDDAGLFTDAERAALETDIAAIAQDFAFDIVVLAVDGTGGARPVDFADDYFDYNGYGYGEGRDGVLFLIAMSSRDWYLSTSGYGIYAFTDYGIRRIEDQIVPYLSQERYYDGFQEFLNTARGYLEAARGGDPVDAPGARGAAGAQGDRGSRGPRGAFDPASVAVAAAASVVLGLIVAGGFAFSMRTARPQRQANAYIAQDSFRLTERSDIYLYRTVTKTRINTESSTGGGSSTHMGSSGRTHGGGGGKF